MFCKKCGNDLKEGAAFCPKCGTPVNTEGSAGKAKDDAGHAAGRDGGIPTFTSIADMEFGTASQKSVNPSTEGGKGDGKAALQAAGSLVGGLGNAAGRAAGKAVAALGRFQGISIGGKKIAPSRNLLIAAAAVVLVLLVGIANGARISNFFHRTFSSPEKYYQYVEKKAVGELTGNLAEWYMDGIDALNFYDRHVEGQLTVELGKEGEDFLELLGLMGVDMSWLKSAGIDGGISVKNGSVAVDMAAMLNKSSILSGNVILDMDKGSAYIQVPEINKKYLGFDLEEMGAMSGLEERAEAQSMNRQLLEAMPNKSKFQKLLTRYLNLALGCVEDVKKSSGTLKAGGVEVGCTELKVTIDEDTIKDMQMAVLEEMLKDKDIKAIIMDVVQAGEDVLGDVDPLDVYEEFQESVEEMLDDLDRYGYSMNGKIVMRVYVDGKGNVIGRKVDMNGLTLNALMPQKGSKVGCELSFESPYGEEIKLSGSGRKSGNAISGDFQLKYNGTSLLEVAVKKLDIEKLKQGRPNGRLDIQLASKMGDMGRYVQGLSILEDMMLTADLKCSKGSYQCRLGITYDEENVGSIAASVQTGKGSKTSAPKQKSVVMVEEADDFLEWAEEIDLGGMIKSLKKADVPDEIIDALEEADELLEDIDDLSDLWGIGRWSDLGRLNTRWSILGLLNIFSIRSASPEIQFLPAEILEP